MRLAVAVLVFAICIAMGNATFKLLQSKLRPAPSVQQLAGYKSLKYPVAIPETTHARPVSTYVSTYSVSTPSVATFPYVAPAYSNPVTVTYNAPVVQYEPAAFYTEPFSAYSTHVIELCST